MYNQCACKHNGSKLFDVCGLHHQYAKDYVAEALREKDKEITHLRDFNEAWDKELNRLTDRMLEKDKEILKYITVYQRCFSDRDKLEEENAKLREIIARWGRHDVGCDGPCTCGLAAALKVLE
jgi:hypothetical protein